MAGNRMRRGGKYQSHIRRYHLHCRHVLREVEIPRFKNANEAKMSGGQQAQRHRSTCATPRT